jgi:hypothetical protein
MRALKKFLMGLFSAFDTIIIVDACHAQNMHDE